MLGEAADADDDDGAEDADEHDREGLPRVEVTVGSQAAGAVCGVMMASYSTGVNRPRRVWRRRRW